MKKSSSIKLLFIFILPVLFICSVKLPGQKRSLISEKCARPVQERGNGQFVRIVFYNVENLYDPNDDTTKLDDEFTAKGAKRWTFSRFFSKLQHLSKTLLAAGEWEPPAIVGMCEIENRYVLNKLLHETPLNRVNYKIIHHESPDLRGVDVAIIFRSEQFELIRSSVIRVSYPFDTLSVTRDILMVKGRLMQKDTIIFFVNHWPSRRGGYAGSAGKRNFVASLLRSKCDSITGADPDAKIIIMGDFNDEPDQESILHILDAKCDTSNLEKDDLVNLMCTGKKNFPGTIRYKGQWSIFDQFIVSASLLDQNKGYYTTPDDARIFHADFLLEEDPKYLGSKLNRTYSGPTYKGGFSDHLPVMLDLKWIGH